MSSKGLNRKQIVLIVVAVIGSPCFLFFTWESTEGDIYLKLLIGLLLGAGVLFYKLGDKKKDKDKQ